MGKSQFSALFLVSTLAVLTLLAGRPADTSNTAAVRVSKNDTPRLIPIARPSLENRSKTPGQFHLSGHIQDDEGNRIRYARIFAGENEVARSARDGSFEIPRPLSRETWLTIRHKLFTPRRIKAGTLYVGEERETIIEIFPYTERFNVTPAGGTFKSGELLLEVPEGAVEEAVTILAAPIPLHYTYRHDGTLEPVRLTAVDFKPRGLEFKKPVTLTMTIAREDMGEVIGPISYHLDEALEHPVRHSSDSVDVDGHRVSLTFSHLVPHAVAQSAQAQSTRALGRSSDIDGDGQVTPSDALFMVVASGKSSQASAAYRQTATGTVKLQTTNTAGSAISGVLRGLQTFSPPLARTKARAVAESFSLDRLWEKPVDTTLSVKVDSWGFDCKMLAGQYQLHQGTKWQGVTPRAHDLEIIRKAWSQNQTNQKGETAIGETAFYTWTGGTRTPALVGEQSLAVINTKDGLRIYVERQTHVIARPLYLYTAPCPGSMEAAVWQSADLATREVRGRKAEHDALARRFHFGSNSTGSQKVPEIASDPWGTLRRDAVAVYADMACGSKEHHVWNYAVTWPASAAPSDTGQSQEQSREQSREQTREQAQTRTWTTTPRGPGTMNQPAMMADGSVEWSITNQNRHRFSEQITAGLFRKTADGEFPFGFLVHTLSERPCGTQLVRTPPADRDIQMSRANTPYPPQ